MKLEYSCFCYPCYRDFRYFLCFKISFSLFARIFDFAALHFLRAFAKPMRANHHPPGVIKPADAQMFCFKLINVIPHITELLLDKINLKVKSVNLFLFE